MAQPPSIRTFLHAFTLSWFTRMSGGLSVPLTTIAIYASAAWAQIGFGITGFVCVSASAYSIWARERTARNSAETELVMFKEAGRIEILFDDQDDRFVRPLQLLHGVTGEFYWVGLHNAGKKTLHDVTLRAQEGWFVQNTIAVAHPRSTAIGPRSDREPVIIKLDALHPGATEMVQLFGRDYHIGSVDDVFRDVRRFALEARARDTPTVIDEFEYVPDRRPMIRKLSLP
jgi:hypothetical protein